MKIFDDKRNNGDHVTKQWQLMDHIVIGDMPFNNHQNLKFIGDSWITFVENCATFPLEFRELYCRQCIIIAFPLDQHFSLL